MQLAATTIDLYITDASRIGKITFDLDNHAVILIKAFATALIKTVATASITKTISQYLDGDIVSLVFISAHDRFNPLELTTALTHIYQSNQHTELTLLLPYQAPPTIRYREDGVIQSFVVSASVFNNASLKKNTLFREMVYQVTVPYLNSAQSNNIQVVQVGKPVSKKPSEKVFNNPDLLKKSALVMPHKGPLKLLNRCCHHLNQTQQIPNEINICFDDAGHENFIDNSYPSIKKKIYLFANNPLGVGPYPARHYAITHTHKSHIFFQDSDDISMENRFTKQLHELTERKLDMIGSHELRVDEVKKCLVPVRFPVAVNAALAADGFHPLFHPTALITKQAYLKTGGFSTDLRFGYDLQFLIRASFYLKMGNTDDFLYIRFVRPNSLTTHHKTKIGTSLRSFLIWRWMLDFKLIKAGKLNLEDSSLALKKHLFKYKFDRLA